MESIASLLFNLAAFIAVISIVVSIHEYGHYIVAKVSGVKIEVFSIGFGKEIFGFNDKSGTRWKFCMLPFGGYVKMFGDAGPSSKPDNEKLEEMTEQERKLAFNHKPLFVKFAVVSAGPIANFLLAIILLTGFYVIQGKSFSLPVVNKILEDSAAEEAGVQEDDLITAVDGKKIKTFSQLQRIITVGVGEPVKLQILRDNQEIELTLTPKMISRKDAFGDQVEVPLIGVISDDVSIKELGFIESVGSATVETYSIAVTTLRAIGQMVTGKRDLSQISGPIGIAKYSGHSAKGGVATFLWFIIIISINLGLMNLLPVPVLDGGHLLFYTIEAVKGGPMAAKYQEFGMKVGFALIIALMAFAVINDFRKIL